MKFLFQFRLGHRSLHTASDSNGVALAWSYGAIGNNRLASASSGFYTRSYSAGREPEDGGPRADSGGRYGARSSSVSRGSQ